MRRLDDMRSEDVKSLASLNSTNQSSSPELTGGAGFTYEDSVVAYYLAALLRQETAAGQEGTVTSVAVQQAGNGHPMDDVIVEFKDDYSRRRISLQVKRQITISAAASNADFREIIAKAVATRARPDFQPDLDVYGFAVENVATQSFRTLNRLIDWAKSSPTGENFAHRFAGTGSAAAAERRLRDGLLPLIAPESPEDETNFYRQFSALKMDGLMDDGILRAEIVNRLQELIVCSEGDLSLLLFDSLCRIARQGAGTACIWTRQTLLSQLQGKVRLKVIPNYRVDVDLLQSFSLAEMADVSEEIEGFRVERLSAETSVTDRLSKCRLVNLSGLPGCGKSAMLKRIARKYATKGPIFFLKSDRLTGTSWLTFATAIGVSQRDIADLLAEIASAGTPILFIDGVDRIRPDQRGIITDILRAIQANEHLSSWKVLTSSRDQGLEAFRAWFPSTFYRDSGIGDVSIELFSDSEAAVLAKEKPNLKRLLWGPAPVREIARRPFFAAVLARSFSNKDTTPRTEVDLIDAWWAHGGHDAPEDAVPLRQRALLELAEKGVRTLGKEIAAQDLNDSTYAQIVALINDCVIRQLESGVFYSFTHDIFFEWVFFRLLIQRRSDWQHCLTEAGEPPLLGRVVGLLAQHAISSPGKWAEGYRDLEIRPLRPQWRREWLTAPPLTPAFARGQEEFHALLHENDYALFEKLLVWFQAQHTVPSPLILQHGKNLVEGVDYVRMADILSWPSDFYGWGRLLDWLLPLAPNLPVRLLPNIVEMFNVWQNFYAKIQNTRSSKILDVCSNWLINLEGSEYPEKFPTEHGRWGEIGGEARSSLATSLRIIILNSAQTYPEPAIALFERAIANDLMRREAYSNLVGFTSVMANLAPDQLIALTKAELMEELPQDLIDRVKQEERDRLEWLNQIRAVPEQDRTDDQRRALECAHTHILSGYESIDLDDIGINHHHHFYFPTSALHEPFAGLFEKNPEVALRLVRDLVNHATKGWRQVHYINRERMGTPIPVVLGFPWGKQKFWGDWHVYSWFMGQLASNPLACALLALNHWAFKQIEAGQPTDEVIQATVEGNECFAVLGLALVLALETFHVSETTLPIVTCQRLWRHDTTRVAQGPMNLDTRASRMRGIRELVMRFAIGPDKALRHRIKKALAHFPDDLPYEIEETRSDPNLTASLMEEAQRHVGLGDIVNYSEHKTEDEQVVVSYQSPVSPPPKNRQELAKSAKYLEEEAIINWAMKSLAGNALSDGIALADAVDLARACDNPSMFKERHDVGDHTTQSMIAAIAACVMRFGDSSSQDHYWGLDVLTRIDNMKERQDTFFGSRISWHPTNFLITGLAQLRESDPTNLERARRLMRLTAYPLEEIRNLAFASLLRDPDLRIAWITTQLALEIAIFHRPKIKENGCRDDRINQAARKKSLKRALKALSTNAVAQQQPLPPAWAKMTNRPWDSRLDDEVEWDDPDPSFNARYAASVFQHCPIEAWCQTGTFKPMVENMLKGFVVWTDERLIPPWSHHNREPNRKTTGLIEWTRLLGDFLARAAPYFETEVVRNDFLAPFLTDSKNALSVLAPFADKTVCRHIFDAPTIPSNTFDLLEDCADRIVRDSVFDPQGYRAGEVHGDDMPVLIQALLFVTVEKADGAIRFVNGDWSQVDLIMPLVTRLVTVVGWSTFVMDQFLTLCERAGDAYPLSDFVVQANTIPTLIEKARGSWVGTTLPARTAGVVQSVADANFPLQEHEAQGLLRVLDALIDLGDRRSVALEQTEAFRGIQGSLAH